MPPIPGIRVVRSGIHGYGVVATRAFALGELIADVDGVVYREEELGDDTYCLWIEDGWFFDMVDQTRWINHSCDANVEIHADLDGSGGAWAKIVAMRPIRAGEELTYDYGFPADLAEPCRCQKPGCIGWIVDRDELPKLLEMLAAEQNAEGEDAGGEGALSA